MNKILKLLTALSLCFIMICVAGCGQKDSSSSESEKLHRLIAQYEEWVLVRSPELAAYLGDDSRAGELDDYSAAGIEKNHLHRVGELKKLGGVDRSVLPEKDKFLYDLYKKHLDIRIDGMKFKDYLRPINQRPDSLHLLLMKLSTFSVFTTEKNYRDFLSQLSHIPRLLDETMEKMKLGLKENITYPKAALHAVAGQLASMLVDDPSRTTLYEPFKKIPANIPAETGKELQEKALNIIGEKVIPAFRKFHKYWTDEYYPNCAETLGLADLPNGEAWYNYLIKRYTTTGLSAEEIHEKGLQEVIRIRKEMNRIIEETGFKGSFAEFVHFLRTDPKFYYSTAEELLDAYRALCKRIDPELPKIIGKLPRLPYGVRSLSAEESAGQAGYCDIGNPKLGRASYLAMTTDNLKAIKKYQMIALILHEMVPGHHLQISLIMEQEDLPFFRKMDNFHAYTEGWALYSESLGYEMGLYTDLYSRFGQLDLNMLRAIRLVVDTGIHTKGWSREKALDYFKANSSLDEDFVRTEIDRYIVYPGQALSYKIGELEFWRLRRLAEKELGKKFDIREFHDKMLEYGSIPLSMLAGKIEDYIAAKKKAPLRGEAYTSRTQMITFFFI